MSRLLPSPGRMPFLFRVFRGELIRALERPLAGFAASKGRADCADAFFNSRGELRSASGVPERVGTEGNRVIWANHAVHC
jgi:hypothetical protein